MLARVERVGGRLIASSPYWGAMKRRLPRDVAEVLDVFQRLGDAARRGLYVAERSTQNQVREAARRASALASRLRGAQR